MITNLSGVLCFEIVKGLIHHDNHQQAIHTLNKYIIGLIT